MFGQVFFHGKIYCFFGSIMPVGEKRCFFSSDMFINRAGAENTLSDRETVKFLKNAEILQKNRKNF